MVTWDPGFGPLLSFYWIAELFRSEIDLKISTFVYLESRFSRLGFLNLCGIEILKVLTKNYVYMSLLMVCWRLKVFGVIWWFMKTCLYRWKHLFTLIFIRFLKAALFTFVLSRISSISVCIKDSNTILKCSFDNIFFVYIL